MGKVVHSNIDTVNKVPSIAKAKLINFPAGSTFETVSYYDTWYAAGDQPKGGAKYQVVTLERFRAIVGIDFPDEFGDHTLTNGNIAILQDRGVKNVTQFGAYGMNGVDDTDYIQAALTSCKTDGGGKVYVPTGEYVINPKKPSGYLWLTGLSQRKNYGVVFISDNTTVYGDGPASIFKLGSTVDSDGLPNDGRGDFATTHMIVNDGAPGLPRLIQNRNIHVNNMAFDGNWVSESGDGVTLVAVENFSVRNCTFRNTYYECSYMLFCRGGLWVENFLNKGGIASGFLQDGGGPLIDASMSITVANNVFTDCGYYPVLAINAYECDFTRNVIKKQDYEYSAGYQGMRFSMCEGCTIDKNVVVESGFAGIWDHIGHNNRITNNTVIKTGYDNASGAQIHGITLDTTQATPYKGRTIVAHNLSMLNYGAGIGVLGAVTGGNKTTYYGGVHINANICLYNLRDGITVYGNFHQITGNIVEANGTSEVSGTVGNGYSGIVLNGSSYCNVSNNTAMDIILPEVLDVNLDAIITPNTLDPIRITHSAQTQNYGIREVIADFIDIDVALSASGTTITVVETGHSRVLTEIVSIYNADDWRYNGYWRVETIVDANTWTYTSDVAPLTTPDEGYPIAAQEILVSNFNVITNNILANNLNNPGLGPVVAGGHGVFTRGTYTELECGINSTVTNNIGQ